MKLCVKDSLRIFEDFKNTETTIEMFKSGCFAKNCDAI